MEIKDKTKCINQNVMMIGLEGSYSEGYITPFFNTTCPFTLYIDSTSFCSLY